MGYTIKIGEASFYKDSDYSYIDITAKPEKHDGAPAFGEPTDFTNQRWPSYTVWAEFLKATGLYDLFTDEDRGLMRKHPGTALLTKQHQETIRDALNKWKEKGTNPGFSETFDGKIVEGQENSDPMLARLIWLDYWVTWAVENCENPVITNS